MISTIIISEEDYKEWDSYLIHIADEFFIQIIDKDDETVAVMGLGPPRPMTDEEKEADKNLLKELFE